MPGFPATAVSKNLRCVHFLLTPSRGDRQVSGVPRRPRIKGRRLTKLRRKTSRGNDGGWPNSKRRFQYCPSPVSHLAVLDARHPLPAFAGRGKSAAKPREG